MMINISGNREKFTSCECWDGFGDDSNTTKEFFGCFWNRLLSTCCREQSKAKHSRGSL